MIRRILWFSLCVCGPGFGAGNDGALSGKAVAILEANCFRCHSHEANKSRGGLMLDSAAAVGAGGDSGPVLRPGDAENSLLMHAVRGVDPKTAMPPKGERLGEAEVAILSEWIDAGAEWPGGGATETAVESDKRRPGLITEADREWWAFQPIRVSAGGPQSVDGFIEAKLDEVGLKAAPEAAAAVLVRRVTFDLTGLPPSPREVAEFAGDTSPGAYERLVDRLLQSPAYGERMARWWLDLVRYADGDGYRADDYRPHAWRYRDYVIRSLNADKRYDRFIEEQMAGDELFPDDPDALIATGYLRHGIYEWNARDVRGQWDTILNDLTDTTGDVFFGLGLQCARCHDHKFDPILQRDYYRLRAVFAAVQPCEVPAATAAEKGEHAERVRAWEAETAAVRTRLLAMEQPYLDAAEREAVGRFPDDIQAMIRKPAAERLPLESQLAALAWRQVIYDWERLDRTLKGEDKERILGLRRELAALEKGKPVPLPVAFAATDVGPMAPPVMIPRKLNAGEIEPGVLTLLDSKPLSVDPLPSSTGRRSALARWLTEKSNPLTARVLVNRVWQQHFGRGLAANASDFGRLGEAPSHPELLDWLAYRFMEDGWSLKKLHRVIVTSAVYRRSSEHPESAAGKLGDPENRLLWRWTPRRLDAEQIRDAMFAVSGELRSDGGGPGRTTDVPVRTIYCRFMRNTRDALADVFDAPLWFTSASSRDSTTTPVQSLLLANSAFMRSRGIAFARRVRGEADGVAGQIKRAYELTMGRTPGVDEQRQADDFITRQISLTDERRLSSGQASFLPDKVPYRDGQAALIDPAGAQRSFSVEASRTMPLDGAFTVEAFVVPRSVAADGTMRIIAAKWDGNRAKPGWNLGITGQGSRRKPLTVAMQLSGTDRSGMLKEHPVFSDLSVQVNKPYFVAAAVTPATAVAAGKVEFAVKDLSNDDEPLLTAAVEHPIAGGWTNDVLLTLGARSGASPSPFDGVLDDVRLSAKALSAGELLHTREGIADSTIGYWKFEAKPDVFADSSQYGRKLTRPASDAEEQGTRLTPEDAAFADFCQALLNASEFLYVE